MRGLHVNARAEEISGCRELLLAWIYDCTLLTANHRPQTLTPAPGAHLEPPDTTKHTHRRVRGGMCPHLAVCAHNWVKPFGFPSGGGGLGSLVQCYACIESRPRL